MPLSSCSQNTRIGNLIYDTEVSIHIFRLTDIHPLILGRSVTNVDLTGVFARLGESSDRQPVSIRKRVIGDQWLLVHPDVVMLAELVGVMSHAVDLGGFCHFICKCLLFLSDVRNGHGFSLNKFHMAARLDFSVLEEIIALAFAR